MSLRRVALLISVVGFVGCALDTPPQIPAVLTLSRGPYLEGTTFRGTVSVYDSTLRVVSSDPSVLEVLSANVEEPLDPSCIPYCGSSGGFVQLRAGVPGTTDLDLISARGQVLDTQIVGVARPDRVEIGTFIDTGSLVSLGVTLPGATIDDDHIRVLARERLDLEVFASVGSSTIVGGGIVGEIDGAPTCAPQEIFDRALVQVDPLDAGAHVLTLRVGSFERRVTVEAVEANAIDSLEITTVGGTASAVLGAATAVHAVARDASGEPIHFVRDVVWEVVGTGFSTPPEATETHGSAMVDTDALFSGAPSITSHVVRARTGDHSAELEIPFGQDPTVVDQPSDATRCH